MGQPSLTLSSKTNREDQTEPEHVGLGTRGLGRAPPLHARPTTSRDPGLPERRFRRTLDRQDLVAQGRPISTAGRVPLVHNLSGRQAEARTTLRKAYQCKSLLSVRAGPPKRPGDISWEREEARRPTTRAATTPRCFTDRLRAGDNAVKPLKETVVSQ
jgi:hypothetical protein